MHRLSPHLHPWQEKRTSQNQMTWRARMEWARGNMQNIRRDIGGSGGGGGGGGSGGGGGGGGSGGGGGGTL
jgi:hypothetical protein